MHARARVEAQVVTREVPDPVDARGRAPRADQQWELRRADGRELTLFHALARCADDVFLTDDQNRLFRFDARAAGVLTEIANEDKGLAVPIGLAADCSRGRLFVANDGPNTVTTLDVGSASVLNSQPYPRNLSLTRGVHVAGSDQLFVAGLWKPEPTVSLLRTRSIETFYDGLALGTRVSLATGVGEPLLPPYDRRCIGAGACVYTDLDLFPPSGDARRPVRVAAQGASARIGLYDDRTRCSEPSRSRSRCFDATARSLPSGRAPNSG